MTVQFDAPQGRFQLHRYPLQHDQTLQAWDAADEYLLNYLANRPDAAKNRRIVILNDSFGALAVALHAYKPVAVSDSYLSQLATRHNLAVNNLDPDCVELQPSLWPVTAGMDSLLIKVPKTLALLEYQLSVMQPWLKPQTQVILAGMVKNLPSSVWQMVEKRIGPTETALAVKKAKLIFAAPNPQPSLAQPVFPTDYTLENTDIILSNYANVFSRTALDIGARFLLQHLPENRQYRDIIDLGCGNGVIGLMVAKALPDANLKFIDESYMAVESAKINFNRAFNHQRYAEFVVDDCLSSCLPASADCIVCNPPFHQQHAIAGQIARQMFQQSRQVLRQGGELRVIGNRHLGYHVLLKQIFGQAQLLAANAKFVILSCIK